MSKKIINTNQAPSPIGPYSQAVKSGNFLFLSGQVALIPGTVDLSNKTITEETHQVMKNLQAVLTEAGMNFTHVIKTSIFLSDMELFAQVNEVYQQYFDINSANGFPARETMAVKTLPKNANVEISMIAAE